MRAHTAFAVYVSLFLATTARGDMKWNEVHTQALKAFQSNQLEIAESLFRKSAELAGQSQEIGTSANDLGVLLHMQGREPEAKQWLGRALAQWRNTGAPNSAALTSHSLAAVERALGDYSDAEKTLRSALAMNATNRVTVALLETLLGDLLREEGRLVEAKEYAERALKAPDLPWRAVMDATIILADVERESGAYHSSIIAWTDVLNEARKRDDVTIEAIALRGLGEAQLVSGDRASAEPNLRRALALFEGRGYSHQIAATLTCLSELYMANRKPAMAEEAMRRAVELDEKAIGNTHPQMAIMLQIRAEAASRRGALGRARADLDRASHIVQGRFGERSAVMGAFLANRGLMEERAGNHEDAIANFQQAASILRSAGPETKSVTAMLMQHYASALRLMHRKDEAKAVLAEAKSFR